MTTVAHGTGIDPFAGPEPRPRYRSREGTFEVILKSALEDTRLSDAARSVLFYLATKPEDWVLVTSAIARDMDRTPDHVRRAMTELRKAGYVSMVELRGPDQKFKRRVSRLNRWKVVPEPART